MAIDLGKQVGPLPLGAWVIVVGAGLGIAYYSYSNSNKTPVVTTDTSGDPGVGDGSVGSYIPLTPTDTSGGTSGSVAPAITTNEDWGVAAINWLIAQGYPADIADSAIRKYLAGNDPKPSVQEYTLQRLALQHLGSPPSPLPPNVNDPPTSTPPTGGGGTPPPTGGGTKPPTGGSGTPKPPPATTKHYTYYTVKAWPAKGSTLWGIAEIEYGNGKRYTDIYNANKAGHKRADGKNGMIKNPNLIYAGWSLLIPGK